MTSLPTVTALIVSHDGARWLPAVIAGLGRQTRPLDRIIAVDTGSTDGSRDLLRDRLGDDAVIAAGRATPYATAVETALRELPSSTDADPDTDEWIWLIHDDSTPAPTALEHLLEAITPGVAVLGPKIREWPSLRRLLEIGVTISGTGRRETGLERGEYDQGQHDRKRDVLAVNTAGMLVRRDVLESLGFEAALPVFGTDLDFGWRVARAGHRVVAVPDAVVFHVEAAHRGLRRTELTGERTHRRERQAALFTLLANGSGRGLPLRAIRLLLGSLLRVVGFLLVRSPREAYDELAAVGGVYLRPGRLLAARRRRAHEAAVSHADVRHLLAPTWLPYRHGLDFVSDVAAAVVNQVADLTEARRARSHGPSSTLADAPSTGPVDEEAESLALDAGFLARLLTNPIAGVFLLLIVLSLISARGQIGGGLLSGGALLPAPDGVGQWWSTYFSGAHDLGAGSVATAPTYLLPLAFAGSLLLGNAWLVVDLVVLAVVPLAAFGAFRLLRRLTDSYPIALIGGVLYGVLPVLGGAVAQGRLGTLVVAVMAPWVVHAALFLGDPSRDRRWRAAFRTAFLLAITTAFAPSLLLVAIVVAVGAVALVPGVRRDALPSATAVGLAVALLAPWFIAAVAQGRGGSLWREAGLPAASLLGDVGALDLLTGRAAQLGAAPVWLSITIALAALAALLRRDTRPRVLAAWAVATSALTLAVLLGRLVLSEPLTGARTSLWVGAPLVVVHGALVVAVALAGVGLRERMAARSFGWRQITAAALAAGCLASALGGLAWWGWNGNGEIVDRQGVTGVPEFMTDAADADPARGVLVVRGSSDEGLRHLLLRARGLRLGDDAVFPTADDQAAITDLVGELASAPSDGAAEALLRSGIQYVYSPPPVDPALAGNLDSLSGLLPASAVVPGARAWQVDGDPRSSGYADPSAPWGLGALAVVQFLGFGVVAVFAAPTRRVPNREVTS